MWVLVLLFVVLGPLGLPYLWKSPAFSRRTKQLLTGAEVVFTALLVGEMLRIVLLVREQMHALGDLDTF